MRHRPQSQGDLPRWALWTSVISLFVVVIALMAVTLYSRRNRTSFFILTFLSVPCDSREQDIGILRRPPGS